MFIYRGFDGEATIIYKICKNEFEIAIQTPK